MLESPHVAVAAAIAYKIPNPLVAIPLAFASHFLLELVPHWNPHLNTEIKKTGKVSKFSTNVVIADVILALIIGFYVASKALPNYSHFAVILFASFFGVLPDVIEGPYYFLNIKSNFIEKIWIPFQKSIQNDTSIIPGLITQTVTIGLALLWIL